MAVVNIVTLCNFFVSEEGSIAETWVPKRKM